MRERELRENGEATMRIGRDCIFFELLEKEAIDRSKKKKKNPHVTVSACSSLRPSRYSRAARATATAAAAIVEGEEDIAEGEREREREKGKRILSREKEFLRNSIFSKEWFFATTSSSSTLFLLSLPF